jgi:hypothetical protein
LLDRVSAFALQHTRSRKMAVRLDQGRESDKPLIELIMSCANARCGSYNKLSNNTWNQTR